MPEATTALLGKCDLCGQDMIRTEDDCWHPYYVAKACPPEPASDDWSDTTGWPAWYAAGHESGRPGREHFIESPENLPLS